jgi:hypothetical protein
MALIGTWLSTPPTKDGVLDLFGVFCLLLLVPGFVVSAYLAGPGTDRLANNPVQLAGIKHWALIGLWLFGAGLFFFGVRAMQINPLSFGQPIWLVGSIIAIVIAASRCVEWWRTVYPAELARFVRADTGYTHPDLGSRMSMTPARQSIPETTVNS